MTNMKVCWHCLRAIESREGAQAVLPHSIDIDDHDSVCDWCGQNPDEGCFDTLYELI